jgi:hypothetical protein
MDSVLNNGLKYEVTSLWSIYAGKYQTWYTIRAEDHKIPGLSDIATPSFYTDDIYPRLKTRRQFIGHKMPLTKPYTEEWVLVSASGRITSIYKKGG